MAVQEFSFFFGACGFARLLKGYRQVLSGLFYGITFPPDSTVVPLRCR